MIAGKFPRGHELWGSIDSAVGSPLVPQEIKDVSIKLKKVLGR